MSLNFIERQEETPLPAVVLSDGTSGKFVGVDIKGKQINPTFGILSRNASLIVEECNINNHMSGGLIIYNTKETQCRISRTKFINNLPFNIEVLGCNSIKNEREAAKAKEVKETKEPKDFKEKSVYKEDEMKLTGERSKSKEQSEVRYTLPVIPSDIKKQVAGESSRIIPSHNSGIQTPTPLPPINPGQAGTTNLTVGKGPGDKPVNDLSSLVSRIAPSKSKVQKVDKEKEAEMERQKKESEKQRVEEERLEAERRDRIKEDKVILIEENTIVGSDRTSIGIKIGVGSRPKLFLNLIKDLSIGVYIISADPFIYRNSISDCKEGVRSTTYRDYICEPRLKINEIKGHQENGILIAGKNNFTVVMNNTAIKDNRKAGIRVEEGAYARIINNKISNNLHQGILIVEKSRAFIESNYIYQNIKANIAFGGEMAENTVIVRNKIFNSASEGIFVILAARCCIMKNEIYGNYDGMIIIESVPEICFNNIFRNRNNGIILLRGSVPDMRNNNIYENEGVGLILREKSYGPFENNTVQDNEMDLVVEYQTPQMEKDNFFDKNVIGEDRKLPQQNKCTLI